MFRERLSQFWATFCTLEVHVDPCGFAYFVPQREVPEARGRFVIRDIDQEWVLAEARWSVEHRLQGPGELAL
jgi:hypothetical protein